MLPFGRTDVSSEELQHCIDVRTAARLVSNETGENGENKVLQFVDQLPELLRWLSEHGRRYPWRMTQDPWRVYVSEILLQRTRADAVNEVYDDFFERFSDPLKLRQSTEEEIKSMVEELGFGNQRTRTLKDVAEILGEECNDTVPRSLDVLQRPWRVGPYSARATMIFAFDEPMALVDTNFARVIERVFDYEMPTQPHKSERVYQLMDALVPSEPALCRAVDLAILDLADAICTPESPRCMDCPLEDACIYSNQEY